MTHYSMFLMSIDQFYSKNGSEITCKPSNLTPEPVGIISLQYVPNGDILVDDFYLHTAAYPLIVMVALVIHGFA